MQIQWNGLGSFSITAKPVQSEVTVVTNPFASGSVKMKAQAATIAVHSHDGKDAYNASALSAEHPEERKEIFDVDHAGEFEVAGVFVHGVHAPKKDGTPHTVYRITAEGMHVGYLGALDRPLTTKEIEALGDIDILIVPCGGQDVMSPTQAAEAVALIEPRMVIPSYVAAADGDSYAAADAFKREIAVPTEETNKLKITRAGLPEEDMKMTILTRG